MATNMNFTMKQYNGIDYDTLYPKSVGQQVLLNDATLANELGITTANPTVNDAFENVVSSINKNGMIVLDGVYSSYSMFTANTETSLAHSVVDAASATVGNYALFAGGTSSSGSSGYTYVDAYDTTLTRSTPTALSTRRAELAGASVGNYALFAGGYTTSSSVYSNIVDAYDTTLTRSTPTELSRSRRALVGGNVGGYAIFAGGFDGNSGAGTTVDAYDTALTRSTPTALSTDYYHSVTVNVGNYVLIAGHSWGTNIVNAYDASLTRSTPTPMTVKRQFPAAASVNNYALIAGGTVGGSSPPDSSQVTNSVNAYDTTLTLSTPMALSTARYYMAGGSDGNYALFAGGLNSSAAITDTVDVYDDYLVRTLVTNLPSKKSKLMSATVGNYVLFAGGFSSAVYSYIKRDYYNTSFTIPAFSAYKFDGYHATEQITLTDLPWSSVSTQPISGYIKQTGFTISGQL